jgi:16S rRNA (cytosine967-C5)-methyltransferase
LPVDQVRNAAVDVLLRVFERGSYLNLALDKTLRTKRFPPRARRFLTQLVYGTVRHRLLCDHVLAKLVHQPLDDIPKPVLVVLRMGAFQSLLCKQVPRYAMVHTSVELARKRGHAGLARLANAVLKRLPESIDEVTLPGSQEDLAGHLSIRHSMPRWLVDYMLGMYGEDRGAALCAALNVEAPVTLRANTSKNTVDNLMKALQSYGARVAKTTPVPEEVTLLEGEAPSRSKLFAEGAYFIQDPASMLAPHLLEPMPGERVLDLCAAPGGKTTHVAQLRRGDGMTVAMDFHASRLRRVRENAGRLGAEGIVMVCGDGKEPPLRASFDKVLVDAPCTGLGALRRHPDLKWRVGPEDPSRLAELQRALLRSAIRLCKNGGLIVYSVCTFTREETSEATSPFLAEGLVKPEDGPEWLALWRTGEGEYRTFPSEDNLDAFYLMRLRKAS